MKQRQAEFGLAHRLLHQKGATLFDASSKKEPKNLDNTKRQREDESLRINLSQVDNDKKPKL